MKYLNYSSDEKSVPALSLLFKKTHIMQLFMSEKVEPILILTLFIAFRSSQHHGYNFPLFNQE